MLIFLCGTMAHIFLSPSFWNFEVLNVTKHLCRQYPDLRVWALLPVQLYKTCYFLTCHFWRFKNRGSLVTWGPSILRQPGCSWANGQLWLCKRNKAVLILLIGRNVLLKQERGSFRWALIRVMLPGLNFRKTLVEQLSCLVTGGCRGPVLLTPADPPQNNVSSRPLWLC